MDRRWETSLPSSQEFGDSHTLEADLILLIPDGSIELLLLRSRCIHSYAKHGMKEPQRVIGIKGNDNKNNNNTFTWSGRKMAVIRVGWVWPLMAWPPALPSSLSTEMDVKRNLRHPRSHVNLKCCLTLEREEIPMRKESGEREEVSRDLVPDPGLGFYPQDPPIQKWAYQDGGSRIVCSSENSKEIPSICWEFRYDDSRYTKRDSTFFGN
jgi:hypothetical protein